MTSYKAYNALRKWAAEPDGGGAADGGHKLDDDAGFNVMDAGRTIKNVIKPRVPNPHVRVPKLKAATAVGTLLTVLGAVSRAVVDINTNSNSQKLLYSIQTNAR